jgi:hypothetical protein
MSRLGLKVVLLGFAKHFGVSVKVKSIVTQTGELMLVGVDERGKQLFTFCINQAQDKYENISDYDLTSENDLIYNEDKSMCNFSNQTIRFLTMEET